MTDLEAGPVGEGRSVPVGESRFFHRPSRRSQGSERPEMLGLWRDFVLRLSSAPVVSIAKIRGRTRGIGNEFVLACDMRFAASDLARQPRSRRRIGPGRRSAGMAPALGRPPART